MNPNCQLKSNYRQQREQTPAVIKAKCQRTKPSPPSLPITPPPQPTERQTHISARDTLINPSNTQKAGHTHGNKQAFLGLLYSLCTELFSLTIRYSFVFNSPPAGLCRFILVPDTW